MCESNAMGGIPSVIQSTNRHADCNKNLISESKTPNSRVSFENISKKYNFNEVHCSSDKIHVDDHETTDVLLKSNVHKSADGKKDQKERENDEFQHEQKLCDKNSELLPTDLSCPTSNKSKNELKSTLIKSIDKIGSVAVIEKDSSALHGVASPDIKGTVKSNEENHLNNKKDHLNVSEIPSKKVCNLTEEKIENSRNLSQNLNKEIDRIMSPDTEISLKEQSSNNYSKHIFESNKTDLCKNDGSGKLLDSNTLENVATPNSSFTKKEINESVDEPAKNCVKVAASNQTEACSSSDKPKTNLLKQINSETSNSLTDECGIERSIDKRETPKSPSCGVQECEDKSLKKSIGSDSLPAVKLDLEQPENSSAKPFSSVQSVSIDVQDKASTAAVDAAGKEKQEDTSSLSEIDEKKFSSESSNKNILTKAHISEVSSVTSGETTAFENIAESNEQIKKDAKGELNMLTEKCNDEVVSDNKNSQIIDGSQTSTVISRNVKKLDTEIASSEAAKQENLKNFECNINDEKTDYEPKSSKKDCNEKSEKNVESRKTLDDKDMLKEKDEEEKIERIKENKKVLDSDAENVLNKKGCEETSKKTEKSKKAQDDNEINLEKGDSKEKNKAIEEREEAIDVSVSERKDLKETSETFNSSIEALGKALVKQDCKEKSEPAQIEEDLDNEKEDVLKEEDGKEKPKTIDKSKIDLVNNKESILEENDCKEICKKVEESCCEENVNKDNLFEKNDCEKSHKNETEKVLTVNDDDEDLLERSHCKERFKEVGKEETVNNDENAIVEKRNIEEISEKHENEIPVSNIALESSIVKEQSKSVEKTEVCSNCDEENLLKKKNNKDTSSTESKEEPICDSKIGAENILESTVAKKNGMETFKDVSENKSLENTENVKLNDNDISGKKENEKKSPKNKDVDLEKNVVSPKNGIKLPNDLKSEDSCEKVALQDDHLNSRENDSKTNENSKMLTNKSSKITSRKNSKNSQISHVESKHTEASLISNEEKVDSKTDSVCSKEKADISSIEEEKTKSKKSEINTENTFYTEQMKVYNLRHSTCLETKFKHPLCDRYARIPVKPKIVPVELLSEEDTYSNETPQSKTKKCLRGKNSKQTEVKKSQPATTPKSSTPAKKSLASSSKKISSRKKEIGEKNDFAIPEGFLEILGNAEKSAEKKVIGKKRKGFESKEAPDSHQSSENESTPIKRSRRIQEQHQKKMTELAVEMEREQRMLEQMAKRSNNVKKSKTSLQKSPLKPNVKGSNPKSNTKVTNTPVKSSKTKSKIPELIAEEETCMESRRATRKMNSRSKNLTKMTLLYEDESKDSQFSTSRETERSKKRRRGRGQKKGFKPWDVSSESSSSVEEITEEEEEEEPEEPLIFDVNEDEFACEEVDPNAEPVVVRRARTAKKTEIENAADECINDDTPCKKCGKYDKPEWILLCDKCDSGYHTHCLIPPLMLVPDGDWFCQPCEHLSLCQCLHEELNKLEVILKQKEREELRKQRLAYVGISLDNVLKPEKKEKSDESSKEEEEEEEEEEDDTEKEQENRRPHKSKQSFEDERHQKLYGKRSVRARRNVNYQFKEYDELIFSALQEDMIEVPEEFKEEGSEAGSDKPFTAKISTRKKRGRRWKDFDYSDDEDSGEEYQGGSTDSEATAPPSSHSEQESGSGEWKIVKSKKKSQRSSRSRRRRRGDSSEEDWEDEVIDNDTYRPTTRRAAQKAISYREISSEEDEWGVAKPHVSQKRRKASSSESEASFKRKTSKKKRIRKWASSDSSEESEEKSMSSSGESEEEEGEESRDEESENEWKIDKKDKMRLKASTNKKVLSTDEEEESSTQDSVPKKKTKKYVSDESEEEEDEESESEENSEDGDDEDGEEEEEKTEKKTTISEKKAPQTEKNINNSKPDTEKKESSSEKLAGSPDKKTVSVDKEPSLSITENKEFQPKVLVKKELCSVDIPLEPVKQPVTLSTTASEKTPPKTVRKETTKMVPCVIPYEKSPKSGHASNPEEESDKEVSKEEEMPHSIPPNRPIPYPKQGVPFMPPSNRIQFGGVLARHSVPPLTSSVRPPVVPPSNLPSRFITPTNLSTRPPVPSSVVVRHHAPPSRLPVRPPVSNMPVPPSAPVTALSSQTAQNKPENKPYKSTIMEPFSNMEDENESDDEVPLERIPTASAPAPLPNRPVSYEKEAEYRPAAKELSSYSFAPPEEKPFPSTYSSLASFQDYSTRPSPLKPSLVETYPNNSSPSKLTPLDNYSQSSSPKGFISLDSYSENRKKKHFYGNSSQEAEPPHRPAAPPSSENFQGGEIRFPPEPYPCPQSPNTYSHRSPPPNPRDPGTPPRLYSQFPDAYAPPRSPEYYQNHQYYASEERIPRPSYQPNYAPQEPSFVTNPYVATPVPQPNGGFMIDTLLRARNHEEGEDELTGVTDIVSYITQE